MADQPLKIVGHVKSTAKVHPWSALAAFGLALSFVALALTLNRLRGLGNSLGTLLRNASYGFWTVLILMLLTYTVRTLRFRDMMRGWFFGFFPAMALVIIIAKLSESIADSGNLRTAFMVPIIEETVRAIPIVLLLAIVAHRKGPEPSITDLAIFGYAVGAGFGLHEDGLWVRDIASGYDGSFWGAFFPNFLSGNPFVVTHAGWSGLAGLGIGFGWHFRHHRLAYLLAVVPVGVTTLDHISINYRGDASDRLRWLVADGKLPAWLFVAGFLVALFVDRSTRNKTDAAHIDRERIAPLLTQVPTLEDKRFGAIMTLLVIGDYRAANGRCYRRGRNGSTPSSESNESAAVKTF